MFQKADVLFMYVETPLHAGSGGGVDMIDLPIQREVHSGLPTIHGSGIKGVIKASMRGIAGRLSEDMIALFGPDVSAAEHASAVSFTDARLLAMPVRSVTGLFAWITCPFILARFQNDLMLADSDKRLTIPASLAPGKCWLTRPSAVETGQNRLVLEDACLESIGDCTELAKSIAGFVFHDRADDDYWVSKLKSSLVVISDEDMSDLSLRCTDVAPHIKIDPTTGTAAGKALWLAEYLPADTIMYSMALVGQPSKESHSSKDYAWANEVLRDQIVGKSGRRLQFGGDETTGKGLVRVTLGGI